MKKYFYKNKKKPAGAMNYKISTITVSMRIPNCELHLINIGKYLEIDSNIVGIKYKYNANNMIIKGQYNYNKSKKQKCKDMFYNQISLLVRIKQTKHFPENIVNVKLFANGSLHITGVKQHFKNQCVEECKNIIIIITNALYKLSMKNINILLAKDDNNILLDNNNYIYTNNYPYNIIGYKTDNSSYIINRKEYYVKVLDIKELENNPVFISQNIEVKRTRTILDVNGKYIGYSKINLMKDKRKLYKNNKNIIFNDEYIFYETNDYSNIIGNISYSIEQKQQSILNKNILEINYNCNPFIIKPKIHNDEILLEDFNYSLNCVNIYTNLNCEINRNKLFTILYKKGYLIEYTPEKYAGVKLIFKIPLDFKNQENVLGICKCSNKCTCRNITFLMFQSGSVIVTGFRHLNEIDVLLATFKSLLDTVKHDIIRRTINQEKQLIINQ